MYVLESEVQGFESFARVNYGCWSFKLLFCCI